MALCSAIATLHFATSSNVSIPLVIRLAIALTLIILSVLIVGAIYRDDFAWLLRLAEAPLLVGFTILGCVFMEQVRANLPVWSGPVFVSAIPLISLGYAIVVGMPLYRLSSIVCSVIGCATLTEIAVAYLIRESQWRGATSFVTGIGCLVLAAVISSWKAGWLRGIPSMLRGMLVPESVFSAD